MAFLKKNWLLSESNRKSRENHILFGTNLFRNKEKWIFSEYFGTLINKRKAEILGPKNGT